jgi:hypothetical protein
MFEARVQELEKPLVKYFKHSEVVMARLIPFLRKEVAEKEDNDDEEDQEVWPSGSSDDDGPISSIRFPRVKRWFNCPICLNYLYQHNNSLLFRIENFITDKMSPLDVVEQHR